MYSKFVPKSTAATIQKETGIVAANPTQLSTSADCFEIMNALSADGIELDPVREVWPLATADAQGRRTWAFGGVYFVGMFLCMRRVDENGKPEPGHFGRSDAQHHPEMVPGTFYYDALPDPSTVVVQPPVQTQQGSLPVHPTTWPKGSFTDDDRALLQVIGRQLGVSV